MHSNATVIRAITTEFARQFVRPFIWTTLGVIAALLLIISVLAFSFSHWWWLLAIPVLIIGVIGAVIWIVVRLIVNRISPPLSTPQRIATRQFIEKLRFVIETIQTPYPIVVFYVIRDIILRKDAGFISQVTLQSKTLRPEFEQLRSLF